MEDVFNALEEMRNIGFCDVSRMRTNFHLPLLAQDYGGSRLTPETVQKPEAESSRHSLTRDVVTHVLSTQNQNLLRLL